MASDRILTLNIGAGQITLAEFKLTSGKNPELLQYGSAPLGLEPDSDMDPSGFIIAALQDIMRDKGIRPGPLMMSVSGQAVFPRFVKLPVVSKDKIRAMIQAEAEQNVPFPIDELTWDYQLIGTGNDLGEQNAMIVAAKTDSIVALTNSIAAAGLEPETVDVAPLAIYNCVCCCNPGLSGCSMVLDIGSRSTNLVFIEDGKVFYRSIPVAGNAITQEIAKTFQVDFREAEKMKLEAGFVALGGVTAAEDDATDRMSKCIRSVVTRLHAEVNRSINFYRSQQGGSVPAKVYLTGGSSILQYMDTFFREKLKVDVEFLDPFSAITLGPRVDADMAASEFHQLAEAVGMAVRKNGAAKVEINLMPPNLVDKKTFRRRIPFFAIAGIALVGAAFFALLAGGVKSEYAAKGKSDVDSRLSKFSSTSKQIAAEGENRAAVIAELEQYRKLIEDRTLMVQRLDAIRASMLPGMWVVSMTSNPGEATVEIVCRGFTDALQKSEKGGKTAPELFGANLLRQAPFAEPLRILQQKDVEGLANKVREFKLTVGLKATHQFGLVKVEKVEE